MLIGAASIVLGISISKAIRFISHSHDNVIHLDVVDDSCKDDVVPSSTKYGVFLSFRGEDTRDNFSSYLYEALRNAKIQTFMDHELQKGDKISPVLQKTIEESEISVIVFSKNYASSTWCMDELVHIMECKAKYGRVVIPIFYHVDPSNVRKQNGSFGDGFTKLKQRFKHHQDKVQNWIDALMESTSLSGWDSNNYRLESKLIDKFVKDILSKLNLKSSCPFEGLVGFDHHIENIEKFLSKAHIVGIWGMGGISKTMLVEAVFHKLKEKFEAFPFAENVKEQLEIKIKPEFELIKEIVADIKSKLKHKSSCHFEGLVGIDHHVEKIVDLLRDVRIVGIWGMGGIGKTTLAKAVFHELKGKFEAFSFAENVREQLVRIGLDGLKEKCLRELLKDERIGFYNMESSLVKRRLQQKKILLVLDDVDKLMTVHDLNVVCGWLGEGSKIIITSRDKQVLNIASASTYRVPELDSHHASHLFSMNAFKQNEPFRNYVELSRSVLDYCQGNPLAIIVLGSFLYGREKEEWESILGRLNQALRKDIFNVLELSFDGLDDEDMKNMFLDLAYFLSEEWKPSMNMIGHLYGSSAHMVSVLKERSLISVDENGNVEMHSLLKEMGREISRQQSSSGPKNHLRLWMHDVIDLFFINKKEIEAIRCLSLDMNKIRGTSLTSGDFQKMCNLIFLKLYKSDRKEPSKLNISGDLDNLPERLMFLSWEEYPLPYVPLSFCAKNLVHLEMPGSHLQQLWNGDQHFPNLQTINLDDSDYLIGLPDLSQAPNIKEIKLKCRKNSVEVHSSTILDKLKYLSLDLYKEPRHVNIGGTIKGGSSGLVEVFKFLDFNNFSFYKLTMKVFVSDDSNIICGIEYKHEWVPFKQKSKWNDNMENGKLKLGTQSLASLLPFVSGVYWSDGPIEFGNFNQHFDYAYAYDYDNDYYKCLDVWERVIDEERVESGVVEELRREGVHVHDDEEEELMGKVLEYCCSSNGDSNKLTRGVPNSITRWSLLKNLKLKSDMVMNGDGGESIPQVSVLKSVARSKLQTLAHVTLSVDHVFGISVERDFDFYFKQEEGDKQIDSFNFFITSTIVRLRF